MSSGLDAELCANSDPGSAAIAPIADAERIKFRREVVMKWSLMLSLAVLASVAGLVHQQHGQVEGAYVAGFCCESGTFGVQESP